VEPAAIITAVAPLLAVLGGGIAFLINRSDRKRKENEALLIEYQRQQIAALEKKLQRANRRLRLMEGDAKKWREQLVANDITPVPEEWSTLPEDDLDE